MNCLAKRGVSYCQTYTSRGVLACWRGNKIWRGLQIRPSNSGILSEPVEVQNRQVHAPVPSLLGTRDQFCGRQFFHGQGREDGFWNDLNALYLLCTLFLLLLYQLHLRSSGIRSQRLQTHGLYHYYYFEQPSRILGIPETILVDL